MTRSQQWAVFAGGTITAGFEFRTQSVHNVGIRQRHLSLTQQSTPLNLVDSQQLLILMYHHVAPAPANTRLRGLYTTPRQFDGHLRWLKTQPVEFTTFARLSAGQTSDFRTKIVITFDDGLHDNYTAALPILQKYDVPAVIYPIMGELGRRAVTWPEAKDQTPADIISEREIREMADRGIEFGSHLMDHTHLTRHDHEEQMRQLTESKNALEQILSADALSVAYPYGDVDEAAVARAKQAGYQFGLTTIEGSNTRDSDPMQLKRLPVKGTRLYHPLKFRRLLRKHLENE